MSTEPQEQHDTTPPVSGNDGTTPPQAETAGTTPPTEGGNETQPDIDKIVTARLARERKKWEAEADERAKRAAMDEGERLKAEIADRDKQIAESHAALKRERATRAISDKVVDAEDAYAIAERLGLVDEDGTVDHAALLEAKPYLAKATRPVAPGPDGAPTPARGKVRTADMTPEQIKELQKRALSGERITLS